MRINKKLNLVIPVENDDGSEYYVHAKPFSREAFEANYLLFSQAFASMIENGIQVTAGPRVAALVLKDLATKQNRESDYAAIIAEIKRTAHVIKGGKDGFKSKGLSSAVAHGDVDEDDLAYIEGVICFFTLTSAMFKGERLDASLSLMSGLWGVQTTSLASTEFTSSLRTAMTEDNTGEAATA